MGRELQSPSSRFKGFVPLVARFRHSNSAHMDLERIVLYLAIFLLQLGNETRAPLLGPIKGEFGLSVLQLGLLTSAFGIARLLIDLPAGTFIDHSDRRKLLLGGTASILVGAVISGLAPTFYSLFLGQFLIGLGSGLFAVTAIVSLSRLSSPTERGTTLSLYAVSFLAGSTFSPVISGSLASLAGWRVAFFFSVPITGLVLLLLWVTQDIFGDTAEIGDMPGAQKDARESGECPVPPSHSMGVVSFSVLNLVTFLLFFIGQSFMETILPVYGANALQLGPAAIGTVMGVATGMRALMNLVAGMLSDRVGRRNVIVFQLVLLGLSFPLLSATMNLLQFSLSAISMGIGRIGNSLIMAMLADQMPRHRWGTFMGINRASGDLGLLMGPIVLGWLVDWSGFGVVIVLGATLACVGAGAMILTVKESLHTVTSRQG